MAVGVPDQGAYLVRVLMVTLRTQVKPVPFGEYPVLLYFRFETVNLRWANFHIMTRFKTLFDNDPNPKFDDSLRGKRPSTQ